jgi:hypothetical protein
VQGVRFGILCDSIELEAWQVSCLEALIRVQGCVPVVTVLNATPRPGATTTLCSRLADSLDTGRFVWSLFSRLVASRQSPATRRTSPPGWLSELQRIECSVKKGEADSEYFDDEDIAQLDAMSLDFLIKFGFGTIRGAILTVARYGVWSFRHDDETRYHGALPCFWEVYLRDPVTRAVLQRLTESPDGDLILKRGNFQTILHSYIQTRDRVYVSSAAWPAQVCRDILNGEAGYLSNVPTPRSDSIYRCPGYLQLVVFPFRLFGNWVKRKMEDLLFCDMWNVGIVNEPVEAIARRGSVGNIRWMNPPGGDRYFADPSGIIVDGELWILAEDYSYLKGRGVIAGRRLSQGAESGAWKTMIDGPCHLSFPHVFEHDKRLYCLPEQAERGEITLYVAESFPDRWVEIATLVSGFPGVDPTLCLHGGTWWLFCTDLVQGDCSHLHIFHADTLTGPYTPHCNNPVKIDICGSRPAGPLFQLDGAWIRPAQNDAETYGRSITLNRIVRLTSQAFQEEALAELLPDPGGAFPLGLHTIQGVGDITLVDGKRRCFVPQVLLKRAADKASRLISSQRARLMRRS